MAEKYRALLQQIPRNRYRRQDVYDLDMLLPGVLADGIAPADILEALLKKCSACRLEPNHWSLDNTEIKNRAGRDWNTMELEIDDLPEFEDSYERVAAFYRSLPWDSAWRHPGASPLPRRRITLVPGFWEWFGARNHGRRGALAPSAAPHPWNLRGPARANSISSRLPAGAPGSGLNARTTVATPSRSASPGSGGRIGHRALLARPQAVLPPGRNLPTCVIGHEDDGSPARNGRRRRTSRSCRCCAESEATCRAG